MASPFSFHCMICFEEFDVETRYPVILPCGHTYVCNQCADRLERCMECRTPLYITIPRGPSDANKQAAVNQQHQQQTGRYARTSPNGRHTADHHAPKTPPQPPIKQRLPLPKNVVLLSLMEATELAAEDVRAREEVQTRLSDSPLIKVSSSMDPEQDEEAKIKAGTSLAISDCGTYAVAATNGLQIYPSRPSLDQPASDDQESEQDVDTLVRFFHLDHKLDVESSDKEAKSEEGGKEPPPLRLKSGDRAQIVSTEGGWAKLARGYGFVRADRHQLVKVGGSVDRACKLEALLRLLSTRRKQLRSEQSKVDNQFISLMNELQVSLMTGEDLTVIPADTFQAKAGEPRDLQLEVPENGVIPAVLFQAKPAEPRDLRREERTVNEDSTPLKPRIPHRPATPPGDDMDNGYFCQGGGAFYNMMPAPTPPRGLPSSDSSSFTESTARPQRSPSTERTPIASRILKSAPHPSPNALKAGARAWRELHGRPTSENIGIDFRTGLSGHMALLSTSAHPHDYLRRNNLFRGMSNHTGLNMWKPARPTLAMPSFGESPPRGSTDASPPRGDGSITGSGSMTYTP